MPEGSAPRSRTRCAIRAARAVVLPQPGPAMMPSGPSPAVMAACWAGVKPSFIPGLPRQEHRAEHRRQAVLGDLCRGSAVFLPLRKVSMDLTDRPDFCLDVVGAVLR